MTTYQADTVFTPVIPSFRDYAKELSKGTLSASKQVGAKAGDAFKAGFDSAGIEATQKRIAKAVELAAKSVEKARDAEEDATRKVRLEELKLQELRDSGKAKASQLAAAEDRLVKSQRTLRSAQNQTAKATHDLTDAQDKGNRELRETKEAADKASRAYKSMGGGIRGAIGRLRADAGKAFSAVRGDLEDSGKRSGQEFGGGFSSGVKGVLAGAASYLAIDGVASFFSDAKEQASDLGETLNKSSAIFGENEAEIEKWANGSARSLGLSKSATLEQTAAFGDMFQQLGFTGGEATKQSKTIVQFASDLGSFSNLETDDVLDRISAALRGEYDSLQLVIPNISAARVEQEALAATGKKSASQLTAQEKAQATLNIVMKDGKRAAGDFEKTSGSLANQQKILDAQIENLQGRVGQKLVPAFAGGTQALTGFLDEMETGQGVGGEVAATLSDLADTATRLGTTFTQDVLPPAAGVAKFLTGTLLGSAESTTTALGGVITVLAARKATGLADSLQNVSTRLGDAEGRVGSFGRKISGFGRGLGAVSSFLGGPWGIAIGLGVTALVGLITKKDEATRASKSFYESLRFEKGALDEASRAATAKRLADDGVIASAVKAGIAEKDYFDALLNGGPARDQMIKQLEGIARSHTQTTMSGTATYRVTDEVGRAAQAAADSLRIEGGSLDAQAAAARQSATALGQTKTGLQGSATAAEQLAAKNTELKTAQELLNTELQNAINKFTILRGGALDTEQANSSYASAIDTLNNKLKAGSRSLSLNTESGRQNRSQIVSTVQALNDKIKADYESTLKTKGSAAAQKVASDALKTGKADILAAARAAGLNEGQVKKMIAQMVKTPKELKTTISAPGVDTTKAKVKTLKETIDGLKDKKTNIDFATNAGKLIKKYKLEGVGEVPFMSPRARGGILPGFTPLAKGDDIAFPMARGGIQPLRGGEGITVSEAMRDPFERSRLLEVNRRSLAGESLTSLQGGGQAGGLASGGVVQRRIQVAASSLGNLPKVLPSAVNDTRAILTNGAGRELGNALGKQLGKAFAKKAEESGDGPIGGGGYKKGLAYARSHVGHPYVFGTLWDCSGFISAVHSVIKGERPHRRYSTPAFHGPKAQGFTRGKKSPFMVGVNPSPGKFGHMAGTLNGVNIESAGGVGVRVGKSARGWNSPMFSWRGGLAGGGRVPKGQQGDLPFDTLSRRGQRYDPALARLVATLGIKEYDSGGQLPPGLTVAYNGTGKPEPVFTDQQFQALAAAGRGHQQQARPIEFHGDIYDSSPQKFMALARAEQRKDEALHPIWP